jgi:hypothetical protein
MIQIHDVAVPLAGLDPDATISSLNAQIAKVQEFYPALRSASLSASEGVLTMRLRVSGRSRWHVAYSSRRIASSMLRRIKLDPATGVMTLVHVPGNGHSVTASD